MRFMHLADLHIGKRVNGYSMLEDIKYVLDEFIELVKDKKPQAVVIAGDVFDVPTPSESAITVFTDFLEHLVDTNTPVLITSGNHDSGTRLAYNASLLKGAQVYIAGEFNGALEKVRLTDEFGAVDFWLMPFVRPADVRTYAGDEVEAGDYTQAVSWAVERCGIDKAARNVMVAHQFVTAGNFTPERSDSERTSLGTLDNVDTSVFDGFDYVALGHIHGPQRVGRESIRYAGSPLKYSFSEIDQKKAFLQVDIDGSGEVSLTRHPIAPQYDMKQVKGTFNDLMKAGASGAQVNDYMRVILTDETDVINALGSLRAVYPHIMAVEYDNARTQAPAVKQSGIEVENQRTDELFMAFFEQINGRELDGKSLSIVQDIFSEIEASGRGEE